jgi:hypothetical protein
MQIFKSIIEQIPDEVIEAQLLKPELDSTTQQ